jgi:hypothetical protein
MAGCGNEDVVVPVECEQGPDAIREALHDAPGEVRIGGRVKISDCFQQAAPPASVQNLGGSVLAAGQELAERARAAPGSDAAVQLGYLLGAVRRGAGTETGVHYEAVRRLEQELNGVKMNSPAFRRGLQAGRESG